MDIGLIIIGDEIMSGRRQDQHFSKVLSILSERGLSLSWAQYIGDEPDRIETLLKRTLQSGDIVFSTGGIGATPDDHTRQCAAHVLNVPLTLHPIARDNILAMSAQRAKDQGEEFLPDSAQTKQRLKMGEFPQGADVIPNSYNNIPGFSVKNSSGVGGHYFVPGFPVMAWPMIEWVLDNVYTDLCHKNTWAEKSVFVYNTPESVLTPLMEEIENVFAGIKVFSLPSVATKMAPAYIDLGVKGSNLSLVQQAFDMLLQGLNQLSAEYKFA